MSSDQKKLIKSPERPSQPPPPPPTLNPKPPTSLPSKPDPQLQLKSLPQEEFSAPNLYVVSIAVTFYLKSQWSNYTWLAAIASVAFSLLGGCLFMYKLLSSDDPNPYNNYNYEH
ncbi:hypothetical protein KQX54_015937 [Cotesia glomerata]|uniref:Uncharacterized protein n=1 Tax=Cotesia glomerata TaxID=32391 RepID=A0AAV7HEW3_COTGL|nr:hypothetical protein KQX54_015937 [Cotesia glomerata]